MKTYYFNHGIVLLDGRRSDRTDLLGKVGLKREENWKPWLEVEALDQIRTVKELEMSLRMTN